jgi:hypothetical protein
MTGSGLMIATGDEQDKDDISRQRVQADPLDFALRRACDQFVNAAQALNADREWMCQIIDTADAAIIQKQTDRMKGVTGAIKEYKATQITSGVSEEAARQQFKNIAQGADLLPLYLQEKDKIQEAIDNPTGDTKKAGK